MKYEEYFLIPTGNQSIPQILSGKIEHEIYALAFSNRSGLWTKKIPPVKFPHVNGFTRDFKGTKFKIPETTAIAILLQCQRKTRGE